MMWAFVTMTALAALPSGRVEVDVLVGMRPGAGVMVTVDPIRHVEAGGMLSVVTDFYAAAPAWVTDGLEPRHNLRVSPRAVVGVNSGPGRFQAALLGTAGAEVLTFRESKSVPALEQPAVYGTTELAFVAGVALDLRVRATDHLGFNLLAHFGFPAPPSAPFDTARSQVGLGVSWAW